jgi:hypothetical protein
MFDLASWGWQQYTLLIFMFIALAFHAVSHGKPMLNEGQPVKWNFFMALCRFMLWLFILITGGFFAAN